MKKGRKTLLANNETTDRMELRTKLEFNKSKKASYILLTTGCPNNGVCPLQGNEIRIAHANNGQGQACRTSGHYLEAFIIYGR